MANEKFKVKFGLAVGDTAATVDGTTGDIVTAGDIAVNGGDITTTQTTANIVNATATTVNLGGAATTVSIGANSGTTTINNSLVADDLTIAGDLAVNGGDITTTQTTGNLFNATATTVNIGGAGTTVAIGAGTGTTTIGNDLAINGTSLTLDADNAGAGANLSIIANRGSSGTDATLVWSESTGFWTFNKDLYVSEKIIGETTLGLNGNEIFFNNEDGATLADAFITVKKPGVGDPQIKWNETSDRWQTTVDSSTYVNIPNQNLDTTDDAVFDTVDANITDDNYVLGQLIATPTTAYVPPTSALTTVTGTNGIVVASSATGANGNGANVAVRYHSGDTTSGTNSAAALIMSGASGTSTAPGGAAANQAMGTTNFDGYTAGTSNNYASQIATMNQGAGTTAIAPMQAQGYARQAFTNSTTVTTTVTGASGTGTTATLTFTAQNTAPYAVGQTVVIAGMTPAGYNNAAAVITAATTSSISYANATTGFTSGGTIAAVNTVTAAGMGFRVRGFANSTNMLVANRFNFMDLTASTANFKSAAYTFANEVITGSTLTATNYLSMGSTGMSMGNVDGVVNMIRASAATTGTRPVAFLRNSQTATAAPATGDGSTFRQLVSGSNATVYNLTEIGGTYNSGGDTSIAFNIANGDQTGAIMTTVQPFITKLSGTIISATASPSATPGANTLTTVAVFNPGGAAVTGNITATGTIGYTTGAGGTVTQATSRTTGVTLDKSTGAITLFSDAGTTTATTFTVTNSTVAATDVIILNQKSGTDLYDLMVTAVAAGSFNITFRTTGGTTTEQPVFNFAVIKGIAA